MREERLARAVKRRWWLPHADNRDRFVEELRRDEIQDLCKVLENHHVGLLYGSMGMGKSDLAVYFAYKFQDQYDGNVLWITSGKDCVSASDLSEIARRAPEHHNVINTKNTNPVQIVHSLARHRKRLIVLDDVSDAKFLREVLKKRPNAHILITSQKAFRQGSDEISPDRLPLESRIPIEKFDEEQSLKLVAKKSKREDEIEESVPDEARTREASAARDLMRQVDGFPLILNRIADILSRPGTSFSELAIRFEKEPVAALQSIAADESNQESSDDSARVKQSHQNSFVRLVRMQFQDLCRDDPAASNIIRLCCFLHDEQIPDELFSQPARIEDLGIGDEGVSPHLQFLSPGLTHRETGGRFFHINHQLTQKVLRGTLREEGEDQYRRWAKTCIEMLNEAFPISSFERWTTCERLARHVESAIELTIDEDLGVTSIALGELLWKFAIFRAERHADLDQSKHRLCQAAEVLSQTAPRSWRRLQVLRSKCGCARELDDAEMLRNVAEEGVELCREILDALAAVQTKEETDAFVAQLSPNLRPLGDDADQRINLRRVHFLLRYVSLQFTAALALSFQMRHERAKAVKLNTEIKEIRNKLYEEWNQELPKAFAAADLEDLRIDNVRLLDPENEDDRATVRELVGQMLSLRLHSRKHDRPSYADRLMQLGEFAREYKDWTLADAAFTQAARMLAGLYHTNHDYVANALRGVAYVRLNTGREATALEIIDRAVAIYTEVFSESHGNVVCAKLDRSWILAKSDQMDRALLEVRFVRKHDPDGAWAPRIISNLLSFAWLYHDQKRYAHAKTLIKWTKELCERSVSNKSSEYAETIRFEAIVQWNSAETRDNEVKGDVKALLQQAREICSGLIVDGITRQVIALRRRLDQELKDLEGRKPGDLNFFSFREIRRK